MGSASVFGDRPQRPARIPGLPVPRRRDGRRRWPGAAALLLGLLAAAPPVAAAERSPFVAVGERVRPAVVSIRTVRSVTRGGVDLNPMQEMFRRFFPGGREGSREDFELPSTGSGFLIGDGRHVMTNHHVIAQADAVFVRYAGQQREREATLVGSDAATDLAVLEIGDGPARPALSFGDSDALAVGDWAIAVGNPFGNLEGSLTVGVISAKGRSDLVISGGTPRYQDFIQTDASINFGNSGGPLVDIEGRVIGVNTAVNTGGQGIGFAVPSNLAAWIGDQLIAHGRVVRGYLGVRTVSPGGEAGSPGAGAEVAAVAAGTPAENVGFKRGDVIVSFAGRPVRSPHDLQFLVARTAPGQEVEVGIRRGGDEMSLPVVLAELQPAGEEGGAPGDGLGLEAASLADPSARVERLRQTLGLEAGPGVIVVSVEPDGPAAEAGIRPGDVLVSIAGRELPDLDAYRRLLGELGERSDPVPVLVRTGTVENYVTISPRRRGVEQ